MNWHDCTRVLMGWRDSPRVLMFFAYVMLAGCVFVLTAMPAISRTTIYKVEESRVHIIGERLFGTRKADPGAYISDYEWVPKSLSVYLNGKRLRKYTDYREYPPDRTIYFKCFTDGKSVIIVDYEKK